jgi:hypothetical protein
MTKKQAIKLFDEKKVRTVWDDEHDKIKLDKQKEFMEKKRWIELAVKIVVAALTAFLTALGTTSCMRLL